MPTPKHLQQPVTENCYKIIPNCYLYLISNTGKVYKKSTWKEISNVDNSVTLTTAEGQRIKLSVPKLLRELFPSTNPSTDENKKVTKRGHSITFLDKNVTKHPQIVTSEHVSQEYDFTYGEEQEKIKSSARKLVINPPRRNTTFIPQEDIDLLNVINFHAEKELQKRFKSLSEVPEDIISKYR